MEKIWENVDAKFRQWYDHDFPYSSDPKKNRIKCGNTPTHSIEMINDIAEVDIEKCIGCGICAAGCPNDAIRMERQLDIPDPPANIMEYGMQLLQEQGKLEAFIEVSTPKAE